MPSFFRYDGTVQDPTGLAIPGASVAVLTQPASFATQPGSPLQAIYAANASNSATIIGATWNGGQITFQFSTTPPADVVAGSFIKVSGITPSAYNTTLSTPYLVLSVEGNFVIVVSLNNPGSYISGGTVATSVLPNPTASDGNGNYFFYAAPSIYSVQIYGPTIAERDYPDQGVGASGAGTVTSVALTAPAEISVAGSPVSSSGTLALSWANENANRVFAGPASGGAGTPSFRALVVADLPGGAGIVSSVAVTLTVPPIFTSSVTGSPITSSGTIAETIGLATQTANTVWAGPSSGSAATPTFRPLIAADFPIAFPWIDIQDYGGIPKPAAIAGQTTTANTIANSPNVAIGAANSFVNGSGVCIWKAGAVTAQSTPSAPTITAPSVSGGQTIKYKIVGYDALGGLTAASATGQITSAPAVFGSPAVAISSISQAGGVVTVNFASPLNNTVTSNMTIHIVGVTGAGVNFNGVWTVASAPSTSQITYSLAGSAGSGTVAGATGRLSNTQPIASISRNSSGVISITTAQNHHWNTGSGSTPTIVIVENCTPADLNGWYVVASASGSVLTCTSANNLAVTGVVTAGSSTATVWESNIVACPALSGTTLGYYIYSDSPSPGGALTLIGKVLYGESHFTDYGPFIGSGYVAPAYVPTSPPVGAQNQMFTSTIRSGGGTTSLVLNTNVTSSTTGTTILYDDGPCLIAAAAFGTVVLSPPQAAGSVTLPTYVFNSPLEYPVQSTLVVACACVINETIDFAEANMVTTPFSSPDNSFTPGGGYRNYVTVQGIGSPIFRGGSATNWEGLLFNAESNGQQLIEIYNLAEGSGHNSVAYSEISDCAFYCADFGTSIAIVYSGPCAQHKIRNVTAIGRSVLGFQPVAGQSICGPAVPIISIRASDNAALAGLPPNMILIEGHNNFGGRGILLDGQYYTDGLPFNFFFGETLWNQAPSQPMVMITGSSVWYNIEVTGVDQDSDAASIVANWGAVINCKITNCLALATWVTGNPIVGLEVDGLTNNQSIGQTQDAQQAIWGIANIAGTLEFTKETIQSWPVVFESPIPSRGMSDQSLSQRSASGGGSFSAGIWNVQVTGQGPDGGSTAPYITKQVTVNGSQGIAVSWTPISGMTGVNVWFNQPGLALGGDGVLYTGSSHTFTSFTNNQAAPTIGATGFPLINGSLIATPELQFGQGVFASTFTPTTLTAARAVTVPDAAGTLLIGSASGIGNGSPGSLSAPAHGTGGGPATPATIVGWTEINIAGTLYWIPLAQ